MNQRVNVFKHSSSYLTTFFFIAGVDNYKRNYLDNFSFLLQLLWHSAWFNIKHKNNWKIEQSMTTEMKNLYTVRYLDAYEIHYGNGAYSKSNFWYFVFRYTTIL